MIISSDKELENNLYESFNDEKKKLISKILPKRELYNILPENQKVDKIQMSEEEKFIFDLILKNLNNVAKIWKKDEINSENAKKKYKFKFDLPKCKLDLKNKEEILKIELPEFNEKIIRKKLTNIQLKDIKEKGKFTVVSKIYSLNYLWKISSCLFHGKEKRIRVFRKQWALGVGFLFRLQRVYSIKKFQTSFERGENFRSNIWVGFLHLFIFIINLIDLIFGSPSHRLSNSFKNFLNKEKRYSINEQLQNKEDFPESFLISNFLHIKSKENFIKNSKNFNLIYKVSRDLEIKWDEYYNEELNKLDDLEEDEYEKKKRFIYSKKFDFIINEFKDNKDFEPKVHKALYNKLKAIDLIKKNQEEKKIELNKIKIELKKDLEKKYLYLKSVKFWFKNLLSDKSLILEKEIREKYHQTLIQELIKEGLNENANILTKRQEINEILDRDKSLIKKIKKHLKTPARTNNIYSPYYPPYKIGRSTNKNKSYFFIKQKKISFHSKYLFWRIIWNFAAFFYYSKLITLNFIRYGWLLEYGIKGLFEWKIYYRDYSINYLSGEVKNDVSKTVSIFQRFQKVIRGIKKSRDFFEKRPDEGIFGKNLGRLCNYLECYFFRLIFIGIFWVIIIHPICNILFITFCILTAITSFVWAICYLIISSLFRYIIYDYQAIEYYTQNEDWVYNYWDLMKRPQRWFPLFFYLFQFIVFGIFQIIYSLLLTVLYPLISLLIFIFVILRFFLRVSYDFFTFYLIIKPFAKIPTIDTNFSHKIAGPGVSKNLFYSLKFEDCIQLIIAELEKEKMNHFKKIMDEVLEKDFLILKDKYNKILGKFNEKSGIIGEKQILQNINYYKNIINQQYRERIQNLNFIKTKINFYKLKFSEEELENLKLTTEEILKNNLQNFLISSFIWDHYKVKKGHFKRLTSIILKNVFKNFKGVFESIEKTEERIILKKENKKKNTKSKMIKQALNGEIIKNELRVTYKKIKHQDDNYRKKYLRSSFTSLDYICSDFTSNDLYIDFYNISYKSNLKNDLLIKN